MKMNRVKSSNLDKIGYDSENKALRVKFKNGDKVYEYQDVDKMIYAELIKSKSLGSYFCGKIKNNFKFKVIEKEEKKDSKYKGKGI